VGMHIDKAGRYNLAGDIDFARTRRLGQRRPDCGNPVADNRDIRQVAGPADAIHDGAAAQYYIDHSRMLPLPVRCCMLGELPHLYIAQPGGMVLSFDMAEGHRSGRWSRGSQTVHLEELVGVRVNRQHDRVPTRQFRRIFRNAQGDWCAEIADGEDPLA
jgi:hypothetical protein